MKKLLTTLSVLTLGITIGNGSRILSTSNKISNFTQIQDLKNHFFANQQNKDDIPLINLNQKGKFYFFNNNFGLVINESQLLFLDKNKNFQEIANPNHLKFTQFVNGQGGSYGILTVANSGDLYVLTTNGHLTLLRTKVLEQEYNLNGKVTAISNTKFLVQSAINGQNALFLGEIKNQALISLKFIKSFATIQEIQCLRADEVIIKADNEDYNLLVSNSEDTINKLSWTGKYFFKTNTEAWVIKNDNKQVLIYNYVTNTYRELNLYGTDIIGLNSKTYILKQDNNKIIIINKSGVIIKENYHFEISDNYNLLNINSKLLLLFDGQQNTIVRIIERNLNVENELVVLKTINFTDGINSIKLLNSQQNKTNSVTNFFIKMLNKPNYILNISLNMQNIEELAVNNKKIPDGMNGEIARFNKTISIFSQYETNNLYWYQTF